MTRMASARRNWIIAAIIIVLVAAMWQQVFAMTSLLWWNATPPAHRLAPPSPLTLHPPATGWVDLKAFLATHPEWNNW